MPEVKQFPKMRVAYVSEVGPFGEAVGRGFKRLFAWLGANNVQPLGASLGIFYDDPAKVAPENLHSEECVPVAPEVRGSGEVDVKEIGGFEVATTIYEGEQNIERAYNEVYDWLRAQGYRDTGTPIETYLSQLGEELRAEVAVPIEKIELLPAPKKAAVKAPGAKASKKAAKKKETSKRSTKR